MSASSRAMTATSQAPAQSLGATMLNIMRQAWPVLVGQWASIAFGVLDTAMTGHFTEAQKTAMLDRIPMGRMGSSDEVAAAVLYLASPEAGYVTGATLHLNGGMAMF